ncbi:MAG: DEAD/DEAH box helicase family protein, partial [Alphaproteobacteria bacterium]|nr:DEAD/DEAH box helicase family protein [Alphaproteobacteria bacterium]
MTPEQQARQDIDAQLLQAGWVVQDLTAMNPTAGLGVAVREFPTKVGKADYLLLINRQAVGVIEAKPVGTSLSAVEAQTAAYAANLLHDTRAFVKPLPFRYESTGAVTRFTDGLSPIQRARRVFTFHRPESLAARLQPELDRLLGRPGAPCAASLVGRMRAAPPLIERGMWPAQIVAVKNLERSIGEGRRKALIQMATGAGKTFTTVTALHRLIEHGGARRVLFLVDRGNLGDQAESEFQGFTVPGDGRKFHKVWNVVHQKHNLIDPTNKVYICTIQRLYSILTRAEDDDPELDERSSFLEPPEEEQPKEVSYNPELPPEFFDLIVIDECHRSIYSTWRQVLDYFDACLIGLTATPDARTFAFFDRNVVSEYRHEHAVRDRVNVPFEVYRIRTRIGEQGSLIRAEPDAFVKKRDRNTWAERWAQVDEDITYTARQLDRSVVAPDQIRTVVRELKRAIAQELFPGRPVVPKTLFFAKSDRHADDILDMVRQEWGLSNEEAVKITSKSGLDSQGKRVRAASQRPKALLAAFKSRTNPRVAVTVDMLAVGTDVRPLEIVVFMRSVGSRGYFEQMKGRGVRIMQDSDFQALTPGGRSKTHFVLVDCVGVTEQQKSDPPLIRERSATLKQLLDRVTRGDRSEDTLATLAGRLDRMERQLDGTQSRQIEAASGGLPLLDLVQGLLDAIDYDREDARVRAQFHLGPDDVPGELQLEHVRYELRDAAAEPIVSKPALREALLEVRRLQEQIIDTVSLDELVSAGRAR